jgi:hypothetical protein
LQHARQAWAGLQHAPQAGSQQLPQGAQQGPQGAQPPPQENARPLPKWTPQPQPQPQPQAACPQPPWWPQ